MMRSKNKKLGSTQLILRGQSGFTLIEVLIAMTIFSIIGTAMLSLFTQARNLETKIDSISNSSRTQQEFARQFSSDLASALPFSFGAFNGSSDRIKFTRLTEQIDGTNELQLIEYFVEPDSSSVFFLTRTTSDFAQQHSKERIASAASIHLSYLGRSEISGYSKWIDKWEDKNHVPRAVKIKVFYNSQARAESFIVPLYNRDLSNENDE